MRIVGVSYMQEHRGSSTAISRVWELLLSSYRYTTHTVRNEAGEELKKDVEVPKSKDERMTEKLDDQWSTQ